MRVSNPKIFLESYLERHLSYIYGVFFLIRSCFICLNSSSVISPSSFNFASFLISSEIDIDWFGGSVILLISFKSSLSVRCVLRGSFSFLSCYHQSQMAYDIYQKVLCKARVYIRSDKIRMSKFSNKKRNSLLSSSLSPYLFLVILISTISIIEARVVTITNMAVAQESDQIQKIWETPAQLKTPESVLYEPTENVLFVSNIDGKPDEKDGQGFISKVSPINGTVIELNWVTGLNAPKGMAVSSDSSKLYVSDITDLVEIDIVNGQITNRYNAPGSAFLNDVVSDGQGNFYVSDTGTNATYKFDSSNRSSLQIWLQNPELNSPNGLYIDNQTNKLVVVGGSLSLVDLANKTISDLGIQVPVGSLDGIEADTAKNLYYVTDWTAGKVYAINSDGTDYKTLIDLQKQGTADLGFIAGERMVIIPMMQDNNLEAYRILK